MVGDFSVESMVLVWASLGLTTLGFFASNSHTLRGDGGLGLQQVLMGYLLCYSVLRQMVSDRVSDYRCAGFDGHINRCDADSWRLVWAGLQFDFGLGHSNRMLRPHPLELHIAHLEALRQDVSQ